jgi:hypothetical protein
MTLLNALIEAKPGERKMPTILCNPYYGRLFAVVDVNIISRDSEKVNPMSTYNVPLRWAPSVGHRARSERLANSKGVTAHPVFPKCLWAQRDSSLRSGEVHNLPIAKADFSSLPTSPRD